MTPDDSHQAALERLAISRERLRSSLMEAAHPHQEDGEHKPSMLMSALLAIPGAHIVVDAVRHWWSQHPMHLAGTLAANTARTVVRPMARRNPFALILGAMVVGGVIVWLKPWRGIVKPALLAGLVPQIVSRAISHVPIESWISTLVTMVTLRSATRGSDAPAAEPPATAGAPSAAAPAHDRPPSSTLH